MRNHHIDQQVSNILLRYHSPVALLRPCQVHQPVLQLNSLPGNAAVCEIKCSIGALDLQASCHTSLSPSDLLKGMMWVISTEAKQMRNHHMPACWAACIFSTSMQSLQSWCQVRMLPWMLSCDA